MVGRPGWYGDYRSWNEAKANSTGYDSRLIVEKVKNGLLDVRNGKAAFERDSVTFAEFEYVWPVLSGLLWIAAQNRGYLNVIDFGGSLGSSYVQYRKFLATLEVNWNIIEQPLFVQEGKQHFQSDRLKFYSSIQECMAENKVDVILLSSVLPYVEKPYQILNEVLETKVPFIIFDKMPFVTQSERDILTVQYVPAHIYKASYPAWFFNEQKFKNVLSASYEILEEFVDEDRANVPSIYKGLITKRKAD